MLGLILDDVEQVSVTYRLIAIALVMVTPGAMLIEQAVEDEKARKWVEDHPADWSS